MHGIVRNIHLLAALFCGAFVWMYAWSAMQMAHNTWFDLKPRVVEHTVTLAPGLDGRAAGRELMDRHGVRGEIMQIRPASGSTAIRIVRPGTVYDVNYSPGNGNAAVKENIAGSMGLLNRVHHIGGLWHDYTLTNVWAVFVGLVSVGLIVISATGLYLWFKLRPERLSGAVLLTAGLLFSLTLMVLLRAG
jgi:hypothetical protein